MLSKAKIWLLAARPKTLWAAVAPVMIGTAMAWSDGGLHLPAALCALGAALLIQVGTNFANDFFDFKKGADTDERLGPVRVTQAGLVTQAQIRVAMMVTFALAALVSGFLIYRGGWPIVIIGVASIVSGVGYTAGRYALGYMGLGDLFVLLFFGPVAVGGTYYVQTLGITPEVLLAGCAPGLLSVAILAVNNLRDVDQDRNAGKRTLAVRFGVGFARGEYALCILVALAIPVVLWRWTQGHPFVLLTLLGLAICQAPLRVVLAGTKGKALNHVLAQTGKLTLIYAVLFSVGWML